MIDRKYEFHLHVNQPAEPDYPQIAKELEAVGITNFTQSWPMAHVEGRGLGQALVVAYIINGEMVPNEQALAMKLAAALAALTGNTACLVTCTPMTVALVDLNGQLVKDEIEQEQPIILAANDNPQTAH